MKTLIMTLAMAAAAMTVTAGVGSKVQFGVRLGNVDPAAAVARGVTCFDADADDAAKIDAAVKAGLKPVALYGSVRFDVDDQTAETAKLLETAKKYGFRFLVIDPGVYSSGRQKFSEGDYSSEATRNRTKAAILPRMKALAARAKAAGVSLAVTESTSVQSPLSTSWDFRWILKEIPELAIVFNTGDFTYSQDTDTLKLLGEFRGNVRQIVFKDTVPANVTSDRFYGDECALGKGDRKLEEIAVAVAESKYDGVVSVGAKAIADGSFEWLKATFEHPESTVTVLKRDIAADVAKCVRPGGVGGQAWWNGEAKFFIYPPSFDFADVSGAAKYRYRLLDDGFVDHAFEAASPRETLERVWAELPTGWVKLTVEALKADGSFLKTAGERRFWKSAAFDPGSYPAPQYSWGECAERYLDWLWNMKNTQDLLKTGKGDDGFMHNCYPTKMYAALIKALLEYSKSSPKHAKDALAAAIRGGDYLISVSQPKGTPLEYFSPTYAGTAFTAERYAGQHMLLYPAEGARAYLSIYRETKEKRFLEAAKNTAATYLRLQGKDGAWPLKMWEKDGKEVCPNRMFPMGVMMLMEDLFAVTGEKKYRECADRAFSFIEKGPLADWNWEGQFEDVEPTKPYENLTKHPACETAIYLLKRFPGDRRRLAQARELLRWSEDQFVCWAMPARADLRSAPIEIEDLTIGVRYWPIYPCALEQYKWYVPIDASAAKMIRTYLALYRAEGKSLDLAKAKAFGDAIVRSQNLAPGGGIPTQWIDWDVKPNAEPWINCGIAAAMALRELAETK